MAKQDSLPDVQSAPMRDVEKAASALLDARDAEEASRKKLIELMGKHKITKYNRGPVSVVLRDINSQRLVVKVVGGE